MPASLLNPSATSPSGHATTDATHGTAPGPKLNVLYVPSRMPAGVVVGLWGDAVMREDHGVGRPLKLGDVVLKGDVLLTQQNGIIEISLGTEVASNAHPSLTGDPDLDRIVAQLDNGELDISPGAGLSGSDGSLQPGIVVDRVIEIVTPQEYQFAWDQLQPSPLGDEPAAPTALITMPEPADIDAQLRIDGPTSVIEGRTAGGYTVTLSHPSGTDIEVSLTYSGTATDGSDYARVATVTIPAGKTSATFDIHTIDDALAEGSETYTIALGDVTGGDFASLTVDPTHATVTTTILDDAGPGGPEAPGPEDTCLVSLSGPGAVVEGETASGYTVHLSQPAAADVTVKLTYAGTAADGADYTAVTEVTIAAGQSSATFDIRTIDDALAEGSESFTVSVGSISGGGFEAVAADPVRSSITTTITDDVTPGGPGTPGSEDTCLVSLSGPGAVVEGETASGYTVHLSQPAAADVTVKLTYAGTAADGADYTAVTEVTIAAGQSSATFDIRTIDDALAEGSESFTVSVGSISGGGFEAVAADPVRSSITTTLIDDTCTPDAVQVALSGPDSVIEGEVATGYTVTLTQPAVTDVVVHLSYSGTASDGADFTKVAAITIAAGQSSATFAIATVDDALAEGSEHFVVAIDGIDGGGFERIAVDANHASVQTALIDDTGPCAPGGPGTPDDADRVLVALSGPDSVTEGDTAAGYTVSLSQPAVTDVTVRLVYSGTAAEGADFVKVATVTIPAGQSSARFDLATLDDALAEGTETITVALGQISGGGFEEIAGDPAHASVTTRLLDDSGPGAPGGGTPPDTADTVLVSLSGPGSVTEGETAGGYTVSLSQPAASDVTVKLTYSGTATDGSDFTAVTEVVIRAGQSSTTFDLRTIDDALAEGTETITVALGTISGGGFEALVANPVAQAVTTQLVDDVGPGGATPGSEDTCQVSLSGPGSVVEGQVAGGYAVTLSQPALTDVVVRLNYAGTATDGSDYVRVVSVTIPAGQSTTRFDIATLADAASEGTEHFTVSLGTLTGGGFEALRGNPSAFSVTTEIVDVAVNHAPLTEADSGRAPEDGSAHGNVLTNDRDPDGDALTVTQFTWNDQTHAAGTPLTLPGIGTLVVQPDGSYVFTPAPDYAGAVPPVSCTVSDGHGGTAVSALTLAIDPVNDAPRLAGGSVTLSEEGLPGGHPDSATETRATHVTGTLQFSDADNDHLSFTLSAPSGLYASGGQALVWHGDGSATSPLVGSAGGQAVLTATIDDQGRYEITLHAPIDHPVRNTEDALTLSLGVQVSDGQATSTASLDVTVRDDSPTPFCIARCADLSLVQTNLLITLDVSGSMSTCDGVGGQTRLQSAIASINKLIDNYADQGDVAVRLVTFSTGAAERGDHWMSISEAKSLLACLSAGGNTNYDAALDAARGAFDDPGLLPGGQNVAYFFSDGRPNLPSCDVGIDAGEQKVWEDFLTAHDIQSYAIGLGSDEPVAALAPVAFDGLSGQDSIDPLVVTRFDQLDAVLSQTVAPALSGDLTDSGGLQELAGADGGHLSDIIVNGVHHPWDPAATSDPSVTVRTATGGEFTIDMTTGHYSYQPPAGAQADYREVLTFTLTDRDGDSRNGTLTLNVNADGNSSFDVHCTASSSCLSSGDVLTWTLSDPCGSGTTSTSGSGSGCDSLQSHDLLGGGSHDALACWSSSGTTTSGSTDGHAGTSSSSGTPTTTGPDCPTLSSTEWQLAQTLIRQGSDSTCSH
jgi:hypothetical protein